MAVCSGKSLQFALIDSIVTKQLIAMLQMAVNAQFTDVLRCSECIANGCKAGFSGLDDMHLNALGLQLLGEFCLIGKAGVDQCDGLRCGACLYAQCCVVLRRITSSFCSGLVFTVCERAVLICGVHFLCCDHGRAVKQQALLKSKRVAGGAKGTGWVTHGSISTVWFHKDAHANAWLRMEPSFEVKPLIWCRTWWTITGGLSQ